MRRIVQFFTAILFNSYFGINPSKSIFLYQGSLKKVCVPILNCYSCPLAWGSCPIGAFQQTLKGGVFPYFITGYFSIIGILSGRMVCGWLCPFGLIQELLYKIQTFKLHIPKHFRYFKYIVLALTLLLPYFLHDPVFCKYVCPAGTFEAGIWQLILQPWLIPQAGFIFSLKYSILIMFIAGSISMKRFFCITMCPIGAIYGVFNKISLLQLKVNFEKTTKETCNECNLCKLHCPMDIAIFENEKHIDCIRCMECIKVCPYNAISSNLSIFNNKINGKTAENVFEDNPNIVLPEQ